MTKDSMLTRREAMQGILGTAVAAMFPATAHAGLKMNGVSWPEGALRDPERAQPFIDNWRFYRGDATGAEATSFDDAGWRMLDVPHDWSIEDLPPIVEQGRDAIWTEGTPPFHAGPFDLYASEGQIATGWTVGGVGWYRKTFPKPDVPAGGKVELRFEGVYMNSDVWLNGTHLGNHPYGYTEFAYYLTPHLRDGQNTVAVRVNNTGRNSRWYSGSGIYRKVWLTVEEELRIPAHGVCVTMPEVGADEALINLAITVENGAAETNRATMRARLLDTEGTTVSEGQSPVTVDANGQTTATCALRLKSPRLWSPKDPYLYRVDVVLEAKGKVADTASLSLGVRKIEIDAAQGFRINGESIKMRGGCVHHDNGPLGSVCIPRAEERRVEILKSNGYNAIRTSHNPPSRDFLDACDRLGMLVIDEAFDCWEVAKNPEDYHLYFKAWWQRDLESMILRDRNHPSVILWSIANEVNERAEPQGVAIGKELAAYAHKLDPTRKVTAGICEPYDHPKQTWQDMQPAFTYLDVAGYNYRLDQYGNDHAKYPERIIVGTESYPGAAFENWRAIESSSWVIGDFVWTAMDHIGESGLGRATLRNGPGRDGGLGPYPWFISYAGDIDLIGNKKPASYFRDVVWRRSKVEMAVQRPVPNGWTEHHGEWGWSDELHSWTWPGFEDSPMTVRVYTRANRVKMLLNGREVGAKDLIEQDALKVEFKVPYSPGELQAIAYDGEKEIGSIKFTTAGYVRKLIISADRTLLKASRDDLSYVTVTAADDHDNPLPDAVVPVSFAILGAGEIAAVGNANPKELASFRQPRCHTFHGRCVAVIRPTGNPGAIEIRAESPGLAGATMRLNVADSAPVHRSNQPLKAHEQ